MEKMSDTLLVEELEKRLLDAGRARNDLVLLTEKLEKLNKKLSESERLKGNFLSNIRNEINNPLASILGIARELAGPVKDDETRQLMARMIFSEAFDLDFQLRNIFIAAELEAGETALHVSRIDVTALIRSVISSFSHRAAEKKVSVEFKCCGDKPADEDLLFMTDAEKLQRVLANLLANAIEFNKPGRKVTIESWKGGSALHVSITDEGIGIPAEERPRLFERFRQIESGTTKRHRGHGLGLSITKALVDLLNGTITVEEAPGGGCIFRIVIQETDATGNEVFSEDGNEFLFESGNTF